MISHRQNNKKKKLNVQANVKTKNRKKLWLKILVNSECMHIWINKQLVKDKRIKTKLANFSFEIFNADSTKDRKVTRIVPLEVEINRHKKYIDAAVIDWNGTDIFLEHDWLVRHNLEVNWKEDKNIIYKMSKIV